MTLTSLSPTSRLTSPPDPTTLKLRRMRPNGQGQRMKDLRPICRTRWRGPQLLALRFFKQTACRQRQQGFYFGTLTASCVIPGGRGLEQVATRER